MKYLYIVCTTGPRPDIEGSFFDMARNMLASASKYNPGVTLLCNWVDIDDMVKEMVVGAWGENVKFFNIPSSVWNGEFAYHKIDRMREMPYENGDEIVMLDVDTIVQGDLFDVFEQPFDIAYTSRPVFPEEPEWFRKWQSVNLGYTAYRWSPVVAEFIDYWSLQIISPTWKTYVWLSAGMHRKTPSCLCGDQDLICAIVGDEFKTFSQIKWLDVTTKYNWFPSVDTVDQLEQAWSEIEPLLHSDDYRMIHLKGHLKPLAPKLAEALCLQ